MRLSRLFGGKVARWHPFDFERIRADGKYPLKRGIVERQPADVIIVDGAYSSRPEVGDLIDLSVLVDVRWRNGIGGYWVGRMAIG